MPPGDVVTNVDLSSEPDFNFHLSVVPGITIPEHLAGDHLPPATPDAWQRAYSDRLPVPRVLRARWSPEALNDLAVLISEV